jgi:hypothetical protein
MNQPDTLRGARELPRAQDGKHRFVLRVDGSAELVQQPLTTEKARVAIGAAEGVDIVPLRHLGSPLYVMMVDDNAYETKFIDHGNGHMELRPVRALKPDNPKATELYHRNCHPGTTHRIIGDVYICPDEDYA